MNKRKIDINQLKKNSLKGKKHRTISVKYETVLAYFKQKEAKDKQIFKVTFPSLIDDLLNQITALELTYKIQQYNQQPLKFLDIQGHQFKLDVLNLKKISSEYPIAELAECLYIQKEDRTEEREINISRNKLMNFFKNLRVIYTQFCYCVGDKYILQNNDLKNVYQNFQIEWSKLQEKGKHSALEKLINKICRSFYFLGVLIENNIFTAIDNRQRKKREQNCEVGVRSDYERNIKAINPQVSSTYSFESNQFMSSYNYSYSNLSMTLKSQKSNNDEFMNRNEYSQKSERIIRRRPASGGFLLSKAEIKNLKLKVYPDNKERESEIAEEKEEINLLSNDVENIYIEKAFKLQKWQDQCQRNYYEANPYYYMNVGMGMNSMSHISYLTPMPYQCFEVTPSHRSSNFYNLVDTKKSLSRLQNKNYD